MFPQEIHSPARASRELRGAALLTAMAALAAACAEPVPPAPGTQRLVDVFAAEMVSASPPVGGFTPEPTEWRFDGPEPSPPAARPATRGWEPLRDVADLSVRDGRLTGTTTSATSLLRLVRTSGFDEQDLLHEVQVRLSASAGGEVFMHLGGPEESDFDRGVVADPRIPLPMRATLEAGGGTHTYSLVSALTLRVSEVRQILLRPADAAGASFAVESVRLVSRREHLAGLPSGIGWHGLSEIYREAVFSRAPETLRWPLQLPARPQLDLALGTLDRHPVTFRVTVRVEGESEAAGERTLLERTLTTPERWDLASLDLSALAGRRVELSLRLDAEADGILGLWGSPVVRSRAAPATAAASQPPQLVLLILVDTLRRDRLDAYGHPRPTAPNLARLAAQGALFRDASAQGTWTKVSVPSLLTSLYVTTTGVIEFEHRLPASATTLAEVYRQAGYATAGFISMPFVGRASNLHQGYEELHERTFDFAESKTAAGLVDRLLPWLERHRDVPSFVLLHVLDPHSPYRPGEPYDTLWADPARRSEHEQRKERIRQVIAHPLRRNQDMPLRSEILAAGTDPEVFIGHELDWYDGSIRAMDTEIGRIFERLRELSLADKTLAVLTSDHGEEFLDHDRMFHGQSVYGELTNVPMLIWYPEVVPPAVLDETVQLIDLMPTVLELSGLPVPEAAQGQSAVPLLMRAATAVPPRLQAAAGGRWQPRPAISEKHTARSLFVPPPLDTASTALVFDGWKLIHHSARPAGEPEYELFDHRQDPLDQYDLAADNPAVVERLAAMLAAWREKAESERLPDDEAATLAMSPKELDRLRALGYVP